MSSSPPPSPRLSYLAKLPPLPREKLSLGAWVQSFSIVSAIKWVSAKIAEGRRQLNAALVPPEHMRSTWLWFLFTVMAFNILAFSNLGLSVFEQLYLVNQYGHTAQDTQWPPIVTQLTGMVALPISLITDKYNFFGLGYRLPYVVLGQVLMVGTYLAICWYPPSPGTGWILYLAMYLVRGLSFVLASAAFNGWIVDANIRDRIGTVQAVRAIGTMLGLMTVVQGGGRVIDSFGFLPAFGLMLAAAVSPYLVLPLMITRRIREEKDVVVYKADAPFDWKALAVLKTPKGASIIVLTITGVVGNIVGNFLINLFLQNTKGLTTPQIADLGTVSLVVNLPGSFLAAYALDNWDVRWLMFWMNILTSVTTLALFWTPANAAFEFNAGLNIIGSLSGQAAQTLIAGVALRAAPQSLGASFLAVIGTVTAVFSVLGNVVGGQIAAMEGTVLTRYQKSFIVGAAVLAFGCLFIPFLGDAAKPPSMIKGNGEANPPNDGGEGGEKKLPGGGVVSTNPLAALALEVSASNPKQVDLITTTTTGANDEDTVSIPGAVPPTAPQAAAASPPVSVGAGVRDWAGKNRRASRGGGM